MGVVLRVTGAAQAVLERHRHQPADRLVAVGPVVVAAHPDPMALQVGDGGLEGVSAGLGHLPADRVAAAGGQQRHALGGAEAVVKRLHPLIDPLAPMLPRLAECFAVQLVGIVAQDLAAEPLDRLHLDPPGAAQPAGRLDRPHVALERLGPGASASSSATPWSAARVLSASSSGPAASLERGSARHSGVQRTSPVAGSRPWNIARTCSGEATPSRPAAAAALPTNRPGDSPRPEKYSSRLRAIWSSQ